MEECDTDAGEYTPSNGGQRCSNCSGEFINVEQTACVATCSVNEGEYASTDSTSNQCVSNCDEGEFINVDQTHCVAQCDNDAGEYRSEVVDSIQCSDCSNVFVNLAGTACITACTEENAYVSSDSDSNRCSNCSGEYINLAGTACVTECADGEVLNLEGTRCLSACPDNQF